jgi:hypothetical protein
MSHVNARVIVVVLYKPSAFRLLILPLIKSSHDYNMCILFFASLGGSRHVTKYFGSAASRARERDHAATGMFSALNLQELVAGWGHWRPSKQPI